MIARTNDAISCAGTRSAIRFSASERLSPTRTSPSAISNSSMSGPSMCSVSFEIAPSKPRPASTLTARRSSASGSYAATSSARLRARTETTNDGAMKPSAPKPAARCTAALPDAAPPRVAPAMTPPSPQAALPARNAVGEVRRMPAIMSFALTSASVVFGCTRSINFASFATSGASARSRNRGTSGPCMTRMRPYSVARMTRLRRSREGAVASSATTKAALPKHATARIRSMESPSEGDDLFQDARADADHHEAERDEQVARGGVPERRHVVRRDQRDRAGEEERHAHQHVRRCTSHRGEGPDLPRELVSQPHRLGDHVEQGRQRAADLSLDRHGGDRELEVLRPDAIGHIGEGFVHRPAERRLGQNSFELVARRRLPFVDDRLQALLEGMAGLQRGRDRDQEIRQLILERAKSRAHLAPDDEERHRAADDERTENEERRLTGHPRDERETQTRGGHDPQQLGRPERDVRALQHPLDRAPLLQVPERPLGRAEER